MASRGIKIYGNAMADSSLSEAPDLESGGTFTTSFESRYAIDCDRNSAARINMDGTHTTARYRTSFDSTAGPEGITHFYFKWDNFPLFAEADQTYPQHSEDQGYFITLANQILDGAGFAFNSPPDYWMLDITAKKGSVWCTLNPLTSPDSTFSELGMKVYSSGGWSTTMNMDIKHLIWCKELDIQAPLFNVGTVVAGDNQNVSRTLDGSLRSSNYGFDVRPQLTINFESVDTATKDNLTAHYTAHFGGTLPFIVTHDAGYPTASPSIDNVIPCVYGGPMTVVESQTELWDITMILRGI